MLYRFNSRVSAARASGCHLDMGGHHCNIYQNSLMQNLPNEKGYLSRNKITPDSIKKWHFQATFYRPDIRLYSKGPRVA
ncbi:hypothetical protein FRX31_006676 [Thalictrum thalictroides]|uniref:Uncharacterized protein n=1 Tax=Thalictrum thalictroides TaxID=46969 RepID=A0A7J6X3V1_THATH|nr:hypothetical protein FRX31_006676 [Thalictrum thalictroides]